MKKLDPVTAYEIKARAFLIMTGHMAPGKDSPVAVGVTDYHEREEAWLDWLSKYGSCVSAMMMSFEEVIP